MGAWSVASFGNDTACDWAYGLEDTADLALVREALQKVVDSGENYLEAPDAEEAIAAAEVVARLKNQPGERDAYSEAVDKWVAEHPQQPPAELVALAGEALDRIVRSPSELMELWEESEEFDAWQHSVLDLRRRACE